LSSPAWHCSHAGEAGIYIDWTTVTVFLPACRSVPSCSCNEFRTPPQDWYLVCDHETIMTSALQELHWLPIHYRIQYKLCLLMYSVCQQHCPVYSSNMVQSVANSTHRQGLRSSTCPTRTKLGERAFSVSGPVAWNALPATVHNTTYSKLFKRLLSFHFVMYCSTIKLRFIWSICSGIRVRIRVRLRVALF